MGLFPSVTRSCEIALDVRATERGTSRGGWETVLFIDFVLVGHVLENEHLFNFFLKSLVLIIERFQQICSLERG